jgi:hypothetical protein
MRVLAVPFMVIAAVGVLAMSAGSTEHPSLVMVHEYRSGRGLCVRLPHQQCTRFSLSQADLARTYPAGIHAAPRLFTAPPVPPHPTIAPYTPAFAAQTDSISTLQSFYQVTAQPPLLSTRPLPHPVVMIVDYNHAKLAESDLAVFRRQFGLRPCSKASGCLQVYNVDGQLETADPQSYPVNPPLSDGFFQQETMLDLEAVSTTCPFCTLALVEVDINQEYPDQSLLLSKAVAVANVVKPIAVSLSYAFDESQVSDNESHMTTIGRAIFVSSGDNGYLVGDPGYPATSWYTTAVGETNHNNGDHALPGSGSGCSIAFAAPPWQQSLGACSGRVYADISAQGEFFPEYDSDCPRSFWLAGGPCGWSNGGGTSLSAPLMAGLYAYASALPFLLPAGTVRLAPIRVPAGLYTQPASLFNDVTTLTRGATNNGGPCTSTPTVCTTGPGWDGPSGFGTPVGPATFERH